LTCSQRRRHRVHPGNIDFGMHHGQDTDGRTLALSKSVTLLTGETAGTLKGQEAHRALHGSWQNSGRVFPGRLGLSEFVGLETSGHRHEGGDWRGLPPGARHSAAGEDADGD
jgi:hypothetical protein